MQTEEWGIKVTVVEFSVFPAPLMSTIGELGAILARETAAAESSQPIPSASINRQLVPS